MSAGETMYIPNLIPHAVYNLDETVAVAGNPYYATAIDESAYYTLNRNRTWFSRINGSNMNILEGSYSSFHTKQLLTNFVYFSFENFLAI